MARKISDLPSKELIVNQEYRSIKINDELLRRIEFLERKVNDLQNRNQKLENIIKESFMSFKFLKEEKNNTITESDAIRRMRELMGYFR
jgi:hypothetical protein